MAQATTSKRSSTLSTRKEIQGTPATKELFTVEIEDEDSGWLCYDAGLKNGPVFFVTADAAREVVKTLRGDDPELERGVRMVRWMRLVTTER
jgi:hypothetical protein